MAQLEYLMWDQLVVERSVISRVILLWVMLVLLILVMWIRLKIWLFSMDWNRLMNMGYESYLLSLIHKTCLTGLIHPLFSLVEGVYRMSGKMLWCFFSFILREGNSVVDGFAKFGQGINDPWKVFLEILDFVSVFVQEDLSCMSSSFSNNWFWLWAFADHFH